MLPRQGSSIHFFKDKTKHLLELDMVPHPEYGDSSIQETEAEGS